MSDNPPDPAAPILLFDSGVGGLTVLAELRKLLPDAPIIYAADNAGLPYGEKTEPQIAARVAGLLGRMTERLHPRLACIACNTASTIALDAVREVLEIPIVGTVPAIKPAAAMTQTGVIGLIGTEATIRQGYVDRLEARFAADKALLRLAAPQLVAAAEALLKGEPVDTSAVASAVAALRAMPRGDEIDTVVLACTHFPLLETDASWRLLHRCRCQTSQLRHADRHGLTLRSTGVEHEPVIGHTDHQEQGDDRQIEPVHGQKISIRGRP